MREILQQNFYEILEVSCDTTPPEIERAYRIARATYHPTSAATYSIFSGEESAQILRRVEEAYVVLSDARLRREYDARLRVEVMRDAPKATGAGRGSRRSPAPRASPRLPQLEFEIEGPFEPEDGVYDGPVLRRVRMSRGIELEEISAVTKVQGETLQFIEANRYHELPAPVYLRGFLKEIAKCLRLDPARVADSYMHGYRDSGEGTA